MGCKPSKSEPEEIVGSRPTSKSEKNQNLKNEEQKKQNPSINQSQKRLGNIPLVTLTNMAPQISDEKSWLLEVLGNVEWQVPERTVEETDMIQQMETLAPTLTDDCKPLYDLTLKSLWKNWIDALEIGLQKLTKFKIVEEQKILDLQFMKHKLDFTRIRQSFVIALKRYIQDSNFEKLKEEAKALIFRCEKLAESQPEDVFSALPGIIPRRDTMMLQGRIDDLLKKVETQYSTL